MINQVKLNDCGVVFNAEHHTYTLDEKELSGITSIIGKYIFPNMYSNVSESVLEAARKRGSQNNDCIISADGKTATNHAGGIVGGITNGTDIVVRAAIKPTASISSEQQTFNFETGAVEPLVIKGRHDVCITLRAAVVAEAALAIALADLKLRA